MPHSLRPWRYRLLSGDSYEIVDAGGKAIAFVFGRENAALISQAPELLIHAKDRYRSAPNIEVSNEVGLAVERAEGLATGL